MADGSTTESARASKPIPTSGKVAIVQLLILAALGMTAGWSLMSSPDGSQMGVPLDWLKGTPFSSYFVPGLLLFLVLGLGSLVSAVVGMVKPALGPYLAFAAAVDLLIWIELQYLLLSSVGMRSMWPGLVAYTLMLFLAGYLWMKDKRPTTA